MVSVFSINFPCEHYAAYTRAIKTQCMSNIITMQSNKTETKIDQILFKFLNYMEYAVVDAKEKFALPNSRVFQC